MTPKSDVHREVENVMQSQAATACTGLGCLLVLADHRAQEAQII